MDNGFIFALRTMSILKRKTNAISVHTIAFKSVRLRLLHNLSSPSTARERGQSTETTVRAFLSGDGIPDSGELPRISHALCSSM